MGSEEAPLRQPAPLMPAAESRAALLGEYLFLSLHNFTDHFGEGKEVVRKNSIDTSQAPSIGLSSTKVSFGRLWHVARTLSRTMPPLFGLSSI